MVLRRLNNTEYNFTIQDLTGVSDLNPTREFPVDSAAGEGFTNTGSSLVMSPSMAIKFLDAAKEIAAHAVLLPEGIRFSSSTSRSDWTNEALEKIKTFYAHYTDQGGGKQINLQGIVFDTNKGGRLPVERYLQALFENKHSLKNGSLSLDELAISLKLNQKYLQLLLETFDQPNAPSGTDMLLQRLRTAGIRRINVTSMIKSHTFASGKNRCGSFRAWDISARKAAQRLGKKQLIQSHRSKK